MSSPALPHLPESLGGRALFTFTQLGAWDSHHFMAHYELSDDWFSRLWVIRTLGGEHDMAMSADGQRLLTRSGASVVSVTREALAFVPERKWHRSRIAHSPMRHGIHLIRIAS